MSAPNINGLLMAHPYGAVLLIVLFPVVMAFLNLRWREKASTSAVTGDTGNGGAGTE